MEKMLNLVTNNKLNVMISRHQE